MFNDKEPLVSIILPTFNPVKEWIELAIRSVLFQDYKNFELIVVNDAWPQEVLSVIGPLLSSDPRILLIENVKNMWLADSYNIGIKRSRWLYIARMDHDDIWSDPAKLKKQVDFMDNNLEYALCGTALTTIDFEWNILDTVSVRIWDQEIRKHILRDSQFAHPSVLIRREALDKVWWYNPFWNYAEDYELWLRIGKVYKFANLPDNCLYYRINPNGVSSTKSFKQRWKWLLLTWKYRNDYPNFYIAMMLKIPYVFLPRKLSKLILKYIKK